MSLLDTKSTHVCAEKCVFHMSKSKSTSKALSTQLDRPVSLSMKPHYSFNVSFTTKDELIIIYGNKQKFVVYNKSNGTVALLENVGFKKKNPPMMFDAAKIGALLHNVEPTLTYAVAKRNFYETDGTTLQQNDVILIVACCRDIFLGISQNHRVCVFPSEIVDIITQPRRCFFEGMVLSVKAVTNFEARGPNQLSVKCEHSYEITKGRAGLFDWYESNFLKVPLHALGEIGTKVVIEMEDEDDFYDQIYSVRSLSSRLEDNEDIYCGGDRKLDSHRESNDSKPYVLGLSFTAPEQDRKDTTENSSDGTEAAPSNNEPLHHTRNPDKVGLYENEEVLSDLKNELDDLRNVVEQLSVSQRDKDLTKDDKPQHVEVPDNVCDRSHIEGEIGTLLDRLHGYRDVPINNNLRSIVAEYLEPDVWHQLGKRIKVPVNRRTKIEQEKNDIYDRTYDLLGHWHNRYGSNATLGDKLHSLRHIQCKTTYLHDKQVQNMYLKESRNLLGRGFKVLVDALIKVNPEDLRLMLGDICSNLTEA